MKKEVFQLLDELEDKLVEVVNSSEMEEVEGIEEILSQLVNVQGDLSDLLDEQRLQQAPKHELDDTVVLGYVYNQAGFHTGAQRFMGTIDNIANFIMNAEGRDVMITDGLDCLVVKTFGTFVDKAMSQEFNILLLDKLIPLQRGELLPQEVEFIDSYESHEYGDMEME